MERIAKFLRTAYARVAAGLTALATLSVLLWPKSNWTFDPEPFVVFMGSLGAWLVLEVLSIPADPHPHDVELLKTFRGSLERSEREFLLVHDFAAPFLAGNLKGCIEISTWKDAAHEFHDHALQKKFLKLQRVMQTLVTNVARWSGPDSRGMQTTYTDYDRAVGVSAQTRERIKQLNAESGLVANLLDEFERLGRRRVPI